MTDTVSEGGISDTPFYHPKNPMFPPKSGKNKDQSLMYYTTEVIILSLQSDHLWIASEVPVDN